MHDSKLYRYVALLFVVVAMAVSALGLARFESNMEDVFQWLPDTSIARDDYDRFVHRFGTDDFVVLTWPGCTLDDFRVDQLAEELTRGEVGKYVATAISGPQLLDRLEAEGMDREVVLKRFRGIYFASNSDRTCVIAGLKPEGMAARKTTIAEIRKTASRILASSSDQLLIGGYPEVGAFGDKIIRDSIFRLVLPSCLLSTIAAWLCLRDVRMVVAILMVGGLAAALSIAVVILCGSKWGGLSSVIPSLAYILTVSGSLHLVNYARSFSPPTAPLVFGCGWKPCFFSAITTTAGMLSLCRSSFPAVREFGLYCAAGVTVSLLCQLIITPVFIEWIHSISRRANSTALQDRVLDRVLRRRFVVIALGLLAVAVFGIGFSRLEGQLEVERVFTRNSQLIQNIIKLERDLGPLEQTELVVNFPNLGPKRFHERVEVIRAIENRIKMAPGVVTTLSLADSLPEQPRDRGVNAVVRRAVIRKKLRESRELMAKSPYLHIDDEHESWRISVRFPFLDETDFGKLAEDITEAAETTLEFERDTLLDDDQRPIKVQLDYTGISHLYHVAQENVINDLLMNCATAFLLICPLMIVAVRSLTLGLLAMIPNVYPMVAVYGMIGWIDYPLDIGMTMTASVALGIAVDDTTHFLLRFRDLQRTSPTAFEALRGAYRQCSTAMFQTTLIAGVGLLVFVAGPLAAMTRFVVTLVALLVVALLCDLVMLPGLVSFHEGIDSEAAEG